MSFQIDLRLENVKKKNAVFIEEFRPTRPGKNWDSQQWIFIITSRIMDFGEYSFCQNFQSTHPGKIKLELMKICWNQCLPIKTDCTKKGIYAVKTCRNHILFNIFWFEYKKNTKMDKMIILFRNLAHALRMIPLCVANIVV